MGYVRDLSLDLSQQLTDQVLKKHTSQIEFADNLIGSGRPVFKPIYRPNVNGVDVVDVRDALPIQKHWSTDYRHADINFDGSVDMKDLAFVEKNFGMQNLTVSNAPPLEEKYKGYTLERIINEL